MKSKNLGNLLLAILIFIVTSCTHQLRILNLNAYQNTSIMSLEEPLRIGIRSTCADIEGQKISRDIGHNLLKYNANVTTAINADKSNIDVLASVSIVSEYKGSGWNFLINWPGFLIWTPAWHGYNYKVIHNVNVSLSDARTSKLINTINVPIVLDIRHAAINRTWTEISWLEWSVIAFVGGIMFVNYDDTVTPLVYEKAGTVVADYIAQDIARSLVGIKPSLINIPTQTPPENFKAEDFAIKTYKFDSTTKMGSVTVDIGNKGFQARLWVVKNIGLICASKNVALESGNEDFNGAKYRVLDESIQDGLLTITFESTY